MQRTSIRAWFVVFVALLVLAQVIAAPRKALRGVAKGRKLPQEQPQQQGPAKGVACGAMICEPCQECRSMSGVFGCYQPDSQNCAIYHSDQGQPGGANSSSSSNSSNSAAQPTPST